ncbi:hypothetical protein [Streptomyces sp. NPDC055607]
MTEPHVTLFSRDLLSKWGFNNGEDDEAWLDWCDDQGIDHAALGFPLTRLVHDYLVPVIDQAVTVVDIETCHNPVRAETVNGVDVTEVWYGRAPEPALTPEHVDISMSTVLTIALEEAGLTEPPRYSPPLSS